MACGHVAASRAARDAIAVRSWPSVHAESACRHVWNKYGNGRRRPDIRVAACTMGGLGGVEHKKPGVATFPGSAGDLLLCALIREVRE